MKRDFKYCRERWNERELSDLERTDESVRAAMNSNDVNSTPEHCLITDCYSATTGDTVLRRNTVAPDPILLFPSVYTAEDPVPFPTDPYPCYTRSAA